jgi:excisionase family DNA binding protein
MRDTRALATPPELAAFLGVPPRTLDQWAYLGKGPQWSRVGRHRRYRWTDVEQWLDEQRKTAA